ncbi:MAG: COQ9 family protein [Rhodobacteraceae bacterium]|jgi:ubiquinone biosynthesis protein COQ9|nr:COQ9 family protein [Paracoccaceae bacterium]
MQDPTSHDTTVEALLDAALAHVPFDGWSARTFRAAVADAGIAPALARAVLPRGGVDLAAAFHRRGDRLMAARLADAGLSGLRFRDRIAAAVRIRLEAVADHREAVRRAAALFALPHLAPEGARAVWGTADAIWTALGDASADGAWYTKRATLAAVYGATVLYWLGDESPGSEATWAFLDRRIADVMRIEEAKGAARRNPLMRPLAAVPDWLLGRIRAPGRPAPAPRPAAGDGGGDGADRR